MLDTTPPPPLALELERARCFCGRPSSECRCACGRLSCECAELPDCAAENFLMPPADDEDTLPGVDLEWWRDG